MTAPPAGALPLDDVLAAVSRSFHVSLRLLPPATRHTVALAYLLARATDTVADTRLVPRGERQAVLEALGRAYAGEPVAVDRALRPFLARGQGEADPAERALLERLPRCLALLERLPPAEQALTRRVLDTIVRGQARDLAAFPGASAAELAAFSRRDDLLEYCYLVAGCVGEYWSELHALRVPGLRRRLRGVRDVAAWSAEGLRLGRALQLTNVLRDVRRDLLHGRCYLPAADLAAAGLAPGDLLREDAWPRLRPLYLELIGQALDDARAGLRHVLATPGREVRLRLAALLPLLLALQTLGRVAAANPLRESVKVPRRAVWGTLLGAAAAVRDDRAVAALFRRTCRRSGLAPV